MDKPEWWDWPFDFENIHIRDRMSDREFTETDVREMIEEAYDILPGAITTRYELLARYDGSRWKIVVEPDPLIEVVVVVTAFRLEDLT